MLSGEKNQHLAQFTLGYMTLWRCDYKFAGGIRLWLGAQVRGQKKSEPGIWCPLFGKPSGLGLSFSAAQTET